MVSPSLSSLSSLPPSSPSLSSLSCCYLIFLSLFGGGGSSHSREPSSSGWRGCVCVGCPRGRMEGSLWGMVLSSQPRRGHGGGGGPDTWGPRPGSFHPPQKGEGGRLRWSWKSPRMSSLSGPLAPEDPASPSSRGPRLEPASVPAAPRPMHHSGLRQGLP